MNAYMIFSYIFKFYYYCFLSIYVCTVRMSFTCIVGFNVRLPELFENVTGVQFFLSHNVFTDMLVRVLLLLYSLTFCHRDNSLIEWQVRFKLDERTTLSDLMSLNLHKFEDEVKNIVEKSVKEMNMEKVLNGINEAWQDMNFDQEKHPRTGVTMLRASEELIETLEENQVCN